MKHVLALELSCLVVPHGSLPSQTAFKSLTITVGGDSNPTCRKALPVTVDRWAHKKSWSVTVDSFRRFHSRL